MTKYGDNKLQYYLKGDNNEQRRIICKVDNDVFIDSFINYSLCEIVDVYYDDYIENERIDVGPDYADYVYLFKSDELARSCYWERSGLNIEVAKAAWNNLNWKPAIVVKLEA